MSTTAPARFCKKPVEISAIQWAGDNQDALLSFVDDSAGEPGIRFGMHGTGEVFDYLQSTWVGFRLGHWILQGVKGEFYPCDDAVFAATYDPAPEAA